MNCESTCEDFAPRSNSATESADDRARDVHAPRQIRNSGSAAREEEKRPELLRIFGYGAAFETRSIDLAHSVHWPRYFVGGEREMRPGETDKRAPRLSAR